MAPRKDQSGNETPARRFRLDDDAWDLLGEATAARRTDRSKWLTEFVFWSLRYKHSKPPAQFSTEELATAWERVLVSRAEAEAKRQSAAS